MPPNEDPGYSRLLLLVGGIAHDVKNILVRQDRQDLRIDRHETRIDKAISDHDYRMRKLEAFRWKVAGLTVAVPTFLTALGIIIKEFLDG